jgi:hypothetical protein
VSQLLKKRKLKILQLVRRNVQVINAQVTEVDRIKLSMDWLVKNGIHSLLTSISILLRLMLELKTIAEIHLTGKVVSGAILLIQRKDGRNANHLMVLQDLDLLQVDLLQVDLQVEQIDQVEVDLPVEVDHQVEVDPQVDLLQVDLQVEQIDQVEADLLQVEILDLAVKQELKQSLLEEAQLQQPLLRLSPILVRQ